MKLKIVWGFKARAIGNTVRMTDKRRKLEVSCEEEPSFILYFKLL